MSLIRRLLVSVSLLLVTAPAAFALDGGAWTVHPHEWYSEISGSRAYANAIFFPDGRDGVIPFDGRFQQFEVRSYNEIGWKKNASLVLDLPFNTVTWQFGRASQSVTGLSDLAVGLRLRLREDTPGLILEGGWIAPLGYDKNVFPRLGDGRQKAWVALDGGIRLPLVPGFIQAARGFQFVGEDGILSHYTTADAALWLGPSVLVAARYSDFVDWNTATPDLARQSIYTAGPLLLVRIDDHMDVSVGATRRIAGRNSPEGTQFYAAIGMKQSKLNPLQGFLGSKLK